jgi:hypothetical protein
MRVTEPFYEFIETESKKNGQTKTDYLLSQVSKDSGLYQFIDSSVQQLSELNKIKALIKNREVTLSDSEINSGLDAFNTLFKNFFELLAKVNKSELSKEGDQ